MQDSQHDSSVPGQHDLGFVLPFDESLAACLQSAEVFSLEQRLQETAIGQGLVRVVLLAVGDSLRVPLDFSPAIEVFVRLGLIRLFDRPPASLELSLEETTGSTRLAELSGEQIGPGTLYRVALPLPERPLRGQLTLRVTGPSGAELGVRDLVVGRVDRLDALVAQSDYVWRGDNEKKHFSAVYQDDFYAGAGPGEATQAPSGRLVYASARDPQPASTDARLREKLSAIPFRPEETTFVYALRLLQGLLPGVPPDFSQAIRLRAAATGRGLRVLSLCSGAARIEQALTAPCVTPLEIILFDLNEDLLRLAASGFAPQHRISYVAGDVNQGIPDVGKVDMVICVSAMHHALQLERILAQINDCLQPEGEFLSIGEYVGRNGSRLWPREYALATSFFDRFAPRLRHHRFLGRQLEQLANDDCSLSTYEGVRSEELLDLFRSYFVPVHEYAYNTFMWRLLDPAFSVNFDLQRAEDVALICEIVAAEAANWASGGRSSELHAIYRKKRLNV